MMKLALGALCLLLVGVCVALLASKGEQGDPPTDGLSRSLPEAGPALLGRRTAPCDLTVSVLDADTGAPLADASVELAAPPGQAAERPGSERRRVSRTSLQGARFTGLAYRLYSLRVTAPGYLGVSQDLKLPDGVPSEHAIELRLRLLAALRVTVRNSRGGLVPGAKIEVSGFAEAADTQLYHPMDYAAVAGLRQLRSGADGTCTALGVPAGGAVRVSAVHPDYPPTELAVETLNGGETRSVDLVLDEPSGLVGRVPELEHSSEWTVILYSTRGSESAQERMTTPAADGSFAFRNVSAGSKVLCGVRFQRGLLDVQLEQATIPAGQLVDVGELLTESRGPDIELGLVVEEPYIREAVIRALGHVWVSAGEGASARAVPFQFLIPVIPELRIRGLPDGGVAAMLRLSGGEPIRPLITHRPGNLRVDVATRPSRQTVLIPRAAPAAVVRPATVRTRVTPPPGVSPREFRGRPLFMVDGFPVGGLYSDTPLGVTAWEGAVPPRAGALTEVWVLSDGWMAGPYVLRALEEASDQEAALSEWRRASVLRIEAISSDGKGAPHSVAEVFLERVPESGEGSDRLLAAQGTTGEDAALRVTVWPGRRYQVRVTSPRSGGGVSRIVEPEEVLPGKEYTILVSLK